MSLQMPHIEIMVKGFVPYRSRKVGWSGSNELTKQPGCYILYHFSTNKFYVGSTANIPARVSNHTANLKRGSHKNKPLQDAYLEDPSHMFFIQPTGSLELAQQLEQNTVEHFKDSGCLFNVAINDVLLTRKDVKLTAEHIETLRLSNVGRVVGDETRERMRQSHLGHRNSDESITKQANSLKQFYESSEGKETKRLAILKISKPVVIDGVEYASLSEAARALDTTGPVIRFRIESNNPKFRDYVFKE